MRLRQPEMLLLRQLAFMPLLHADLRHPPTHHTEQTLQPTLAQLPRLRLLLLDFWQRRDEEEEEEVDEQMQQLQDAALEALRNAGADERLRVMLQPQHLNRWEGSFDDPLELLPLAELWEEMEEAQQCTIQ